MMTLYIRLLIIHRHPLAEVTYICVGDLFALKNSFNIAYYRKKRLIIGSTSEVSYST